MNNYQDSDFNTLNNEYEISRQNAREWEFGVTIGIKLIMGNPQLFSCVKFLYVPYFFLQFCHE